MTTTDTCAVRNREKVSGVAAMAIAVALIATAN